jgi:hypothetical protein
MKEMNWNGGKIIAVTDDSNFFLTIIDKKMYLQDVTEKT